MTDKILEMRDAGIEPNLQNILLREGIGCPSCRFKKDCLVYSSSEFRKLDLFEKGIILSCPILLFTYPSDLSWYTGETENAKRK